MRKSWKGNKRGKTSKRTCITPDCRILLDDKITELTVTQLEKRLTKTFITGFDITRGYFFPCRIKTCIREDAYASDKRVIYLCTLSGRDIKVTDDHLLRGFGKRWIPAEIIQKGDRITIYPTLDPIEQLPRKKSTKKLHLIGSRSPMKFLRKTRTRILMTFEDVIPYMDRRINNHFLMTFRKNFPLTINHELLPTWLRLLGFLLTNFRFDSEIILTFKDEKDWMQIQSDFQKIGMRTRSTKRNGTNIIMIDSTLVQVFKKLITPPKYPRSQNEPLQWLLEVPLSGIREFLAGLLGCRGKAPWIDQPLTGDERISMPSINIQFKDSYLDKHAEKIVSLIIQLFSILGINVFKEDNKKEDNKTFLDTERQQHLLIIPNEDLKSLSLLTRFVGFRYNHIESVKSNFIAEYFRFLEFVNGPTAKNIPELKSTKFPTITELMKKKTPNNNNEEEFDPKRYENDHQKKKTPRDAKRKDDYKASTTFESISMRNKSSNKEQKNKTSRPSPTTTISEEEMLEIDGDLFVWQVESQTITTFQDFLYACRADFETGLLHQPIVIVGDVTDRVVMRISVASHAKTYIVNGFLSR